MMARVGRCGAAKSGDVVPGADGAGVASSLTVCFFIFYEKIQYEIRTNVG